MMNRIRIEKISIIETDAECIVNAANENLQGGSGVCGAIFKAAGWNELQAACDKIGYCETGSAVITPGFKLPAKYIIHAVGPVWHDGKHKEPQKLYGCYQTALKLARENACHSIAFPLISAGIFGYPKDKAWRKALQACNDFLSKNTDFNLDILFAVLDDHILKMGNEELDRQQKENAQAMEEELLEKLDGKALFKAIEAVKGAVEVKWHGGKQADGTFLMPFPEYPDGVFESLFILDTDKEYSEHYKQYCEGVTASEMSASQIKTTLTYISRGEHFCDGFLQEYLENNLLMKLLFRVDDLLIEYYKKHKLPVSLRYKNPLFWYETREDGNSVLVKGNGEKSVSAEKSEMFNQTVQSQQGWQRSRLYMDANGIWDATAFGATMSATFAYGPDDEGRCFTFTSCEEADRRMYKNLTPEQVQECRKNVDEFYADPELQMRWKEVILHPICLILKRDGSLNPISLTKVNPEVVERYQQQTVCIGDTESYKWIFENE